MTAVVSDTAEPEGYRQNPLWQVATRVMLDDLPHLTDAARLTAKINAAYVQYGIESGEDVPPPLRTNIIELAAIIGGGK